MTNKINGIDVSECKFYNNYECNAYRHEYCEPEDNTKDMCKWHDDCYYKQLKRLEFELKVTKADYEASEQENEIIAKQYNSLLKQYNSLMIYTKELEAKINEQQSSNIR